MEHPALLARRVPRASVVSPLALKVFIPEHGSRLMKSEYPEVYAKTAYRFDGNAEDYLVGKLIFKYMKGERVLDLGCGPTEPILSVFYPEAREVVAVDTLQANLDFAKRKANSMASIIKLAKRYRLEHLSRKLNTLKIRYVKGDVTKKAKLGKFDSVMQIGCFGTLSSVAEFQLAVSNSYSYLKKRGTLLMVNWVEKREGRSLDCSKLYRPSAKIAGFKKIETHSMSRGLSHYSKREDYSKIAWAVAKR